VAFPQSGYTRSEADPTLDYWDSYWIILGLIQSELYEVVNGTLQNFMDEIESFGFIPNGGRIYCESTVFHFLSVLTSSKIWTVLSHHYSFK
jgi:hypothetical protein